VTAVIDTHHLSKSYWSSRRVDDDPIVLLKRPLSNDAEETPG